MTEPVLRSDCTQCAALCCVAFAFDKSNDFAFDKAAETPCSNLDTCGRCTIHTDLAAQGFLGCAVYECDGAGQRVTQELFGGRSWQDDASLVGPMSRALSAVRRLHGLLVLLDAAGKLPMEDEDERARRVHIDEINGLVANSPSDFLLDELSVKIHAFLASLRGYAGALKGAL